MNEDHWAIVVGIKHYVDPDLRGLEGPENDAKDFYDWVVSSDGGAVPKGQAALIRSSDYNPPFKGSATAKPTQEMIKAAFDHLFSIADENEKIGHGRVIGKRLYLFFSGHGFAPDPPGKLTALLTANASIANAQLAHIIGSYMAETFQLGKFFDEILLFMDCCRTILGCSQLYEPYPIERATDNDQVLLFYAFGARAGKEAWEWKMADGKFHGVFTTTLLHALRGDGYDARDPDWVTAESLKNQLFNGFDAFRSPAARARLDQTDGPEVVYEGNPKRKFNIVPTNRKQGFFARSKVPEYSVTIVASPAHVGKKAIVSDGRKPPVTKKEVTLAASTSVPLEQGFYGLTIADETKPILFQVTGGGCEVHV